MMIIIIIIMLGTHNALVSCGTLRILISYKEHYYPIGITPRVNLF